MNHLNIINKAKKLQPIVGTYAAAKYLKNRGIPCWLALYILVYTKG